MLDVYDLDVLGSEARGLYGYICDRIQKNEWDSNDDLKRIVHIEKDVLQNNFAPDIDYNVIKNELREIRKKYFGMPNLVFEKMKTEANK